MAEKIQIYIVEDYLLTRVTYTKYFSSVEDIEVLGAFETAEECINKMQKKEADIILMDLGLPWMNGLEAIQIIKKKYSNCKIIVLTSHEHQFEVQAALAYGANAYALKDIGFPELENVIRSVNKGAGWFDPQVLEYVLDTMPKPNSTDFDNLYDENIIKSCLTEREKEILKLITEGKSNIEIAEIMGNSPHTIKSHVGKIMSKLHVDDRVQAAVKAVKNKLL